MVDFETLLYEEREGVGEREGDLLGRELQARRQREGDGEDADDERQRHEREQDQLIRGRAPRGDVRDRRGPQEEARGGHARLKDPALETAFSLLAHP